MPIIDSYGYIGAILSIVIIGLGIDVVVHLIKQVKNTGKWEIDYSDLATFTIGSMLIISYFTYAFRSDIGVSMLISMWLILPCYLVLRNLKKNSK